MAVGAAIGAGMAAIQKAGEAVSSAAKGAAAEQIQAGGGMVSATEGAPSLPIMEGFAGGGGAPSTAAPVEGEYGDEPAPSAQWDAVWDDPDPIIAGDGDSGPASAAARTDARGPDMIPPSPRPAPPPAPAEGE